MRSCARQSPDEAVAAEPGGGAKFAYVFSCVLITAGLVTSVVGHPPLVGGAGYADYFDRHRADIVTMHWVDPPADGA